MHHFVSRVSATARGGMPARALATAFDAVVFDKDGTLLDFAATWNPAIYDAICESAGSDGQLRARIANVLGFDMALREPLPEAPVVHMGNSELIELLTPHTDGRALLDAAAAKVVAHVTPAAHASELLRALRDADIPCAVATNDEDCSTREQLGALGWLGSEHEPALISAVRCCDSGHGAKPEPGMVLSAAAALGAAPSRVAMVGDSAADLVAGRRAGFAAVILVGPEASVGRHEGLADVWIRDLGGLLQPPAE